MYRRGWADVEHDAGTAGEAVSRVGGETRRSSEMVY